MDTVWCVLFSFEHARSFVYDVRVVSTNYKQNNTVLPVLVIFVGAQMQEKKNHGRNGVDYMVPVYNVVIHHMLLFISGYSG